MLDELFKSKDHKKHFQSFVERDGTSLEDCYRLSLFYLLSLNETTTQHIEKLYDFKKSQIKLTGYTGGFQTTTSKIITYAAFNLYNNFDPVDIDCYTVDLVEVFSSIPKEDFIYIIQGVKIRLGYISCQ